MKIRIYITTILTSAVCSHLPAGAQQANFEWVKAIGGTGADAVEAVAVDVNGNVYITGSFPVAGADFNPGGSGGAVTSAGGSDVFVAKYNGLGVFQWVKTMGGTGNDVGRRMIVDPSGNVYVAGYYAGTGTDFNPGGSGGALTSAGDIGLFLLKLNSNGVFQWVKGMGGAGADYVVGINRDLNGNIFQTGRFNASADFNRGGSGGTVVNSGGGNDVFLVKHDQNGNFLWAKSMGGANSDIGNGVSTDASGNVYVAGQVQNSGDFNPGGSGGMLTGAGALDVFLAKYDPSGSFLWAKCMGGTNSDFGQAVAALPGGDVYVTGVVASGGTADFNPGGTGGELTSFGNGDIFLAKYSATGNFLWAKNYGGTGGDLPLAMTTDPAGDVYITGIIAAAGSDFNPGGTGGVVPYSASNDGFVARYGSNAEFRWA
jgi:hypothetical protein